MRIDFLPNDYIVNICQENLDIFTGEKKIISDFFLRGIKLTNDSKKPIKVIELQFQILSKGVLIKTISFSEEVIKNRAKDLEGVQNIFIKEKQSIFGEKMREGNSYKFFGTDNFWYGLQFTNTLKLNQAMGIICENFKVKYTEVIDKLKLTVIYEYEDDIKSLTREIPIIQYKNKIEYIFPMKGRWIIQGNWDDINYHRIMHSQEFAFDVVGPMKNIHWSEIKNNPNEDYYFYGADIIAIADGIVVDIIDGVPDHPRANTDYSKEEIKEILEKFGYTATGAGNYVTIKHTEGEYSFYAHLQNGSINVKKNEHVLQGQVIGKLGNSGNSEGPHLHFQLMDKNSNLTGRGLPCYFSNIQDLYGEDINLITQNYSRIITKEKN